MRTLKNHTWRQLALAVASLAFSHLASAEAYKTTLLTALGETYSRANAINNLGQVVGSASSWPSSTGHAVLWNGTTVTDLGYGAATAINDRGQIAGLSGYHQATTWTGTTALNLGTNSWAHGINNSGQVVGWWQAPSSTGHGALWNGTTLTDLGLLNGPDDAAPIRDSNAQDINNLGQIVGHSSTSIGSDGFDMHAAIWNGGIATDLGTIAGWRASYANSINDQGQVVGWSFGFVNGYWIEHATLWNGTTAIDLGTLGGKFSRANQINEQGLIVGYADQTAGSSEHTRRATIWDGGYAVDLNTYLDPDLANAGWVLDEATGINDSGSIVGVALNTRNGQSLGFLMSVTAVPEPEAYALMLAGLCVVVGTARRRIKTQ